jgi:hypothetical protein
LKLEIIGLLLEEGEMNEGKMETYFIIRKGKVIINTISRTTGGFFSPKNNCREKKNSEEIM